MKSEGVTEGRGVCSGPLHAKEWGEEGSCQVCVPLLTEDSTPHAVASSHHVSWGP